MPSSPVRMRVRGAITMRCLSSTGLTDPPRVVGEKSAGVEASDGDVGPAMVRGGRVLGLETVVQETKQIEE
jgi:hypothetical protein